MLLQKDQQAVAAREQLADFEKNRKPGQEGTVLIFRGVDHADVYNPSIPFQADGMTVMAGRVENRENEKSQTLFFEQDGDQWQLIQSAPALDLQDPFVTFIDGEIWLGGVYVVWAGNRCVEYSTRFYHGNSLNHLTFAFTGPKMMKDIRLLQLPNGKIAVFSRPQGEIMLKRFGCVAKIGFAVVDSINQVNAKMIEQIPLLEGQFIPEEWGGCNQLYNLENGLIGVIGHKAWGEMVGDVQIIHYYSMAFALDPATSACTPTKIIANRAGFPPGPQKNIRTADVTFTSGIIRLADGQAILYAGLNDCQAGSVIIIDPLSEYEKIPL